MKLILFSFFFEICLLDLRHFLQYCDVKDLTSGLTSFQQCAGVAMAISRINESL